jgi:putative oxidoreductase
MGFLREHEPQVYALMRIVTGFLFLWHGMQKVVGFPPMPPMPQEPPAFIIWTAGPIELVGGLLVMIGLFTRPAAFLCSGLMAFAYWMAHGLSKLDQGAVGLLPTINGGEPAVIYCFLFLYICARGAGPMSVEGA